MVVISATPATLAWNVIWGLEPAVGVCSVIGLETASARPVYANSPNGSLPQNSPDG
jgi:hypothetical protein